MPHINRVRVNNVKYNFGTQYYDDFVMRFSGKNTIYDLANGGGKSIFMMLLLQNMIPNCTLDEKQPIEKLFRPGNGNQTIHSLVEWKLNSCDVKNGFVYLTTGFCARKGKDGDQGEGEGRDIASIEYFNYCIFYREFNDNDIINLPLSNGKERITYTGLRNYLRDLEKKDYSLQIRIFDGKGDYQRFISEYGIYESEWEIIRGINKTEGHVRTYFENTYRTTRKVVEDLLIEEIIQKSFQIKTNNQQAGQEMARTLLDIKDKLIELSRKKDELARYDRQMESIAVFLKQMEELKGAYDKKDSLHDNLAKVYRTCLKQLKEQEMSRADLEQQQEEIRRKIRELHRLVETAKVQMEETGLAAMEEQVRQLEKQVSACEETSIKLEEELKLGESINDYLDYLENHKNYETSMAAIEAAEQNHQSILGELRSMAAQMKQYMAEKVQNSREEIAASGSSVRKNEEKIQKIQEEERSLDRNLAIWNSQAAELDREAGEREEQIKRCRQNTSLLLLDSLKEEQGKKERQRKRYSQEQEKLVGELEAVKERILKEKLDLSVHRQQESQAMDRIDQVRAQLHDLREKKTRLHKIREIYQEQKLDQLQAAMEKKYQEAYRQYLQMNQELEEKDSRIRALREHKPIEQSTHVTDLIEYIRRHHRGNAVFGQDYLEGLGQEERTELLSLYPYLPYAVLLEGCFETVEADHKMREKDFGDVPIPLIRLESLREREELIARDHLALAVRDKAFFLEQERLEALAVKLEQELEKIRQKKDRLAATLAVMEEDRSFLQLYQSQYAGQYESLEQEYETYKLRIRNTDAEQRRMEEQYQSSLQEQEEGSRRLHQLQKEIQELEKELGYLEELRLLQRDQEQGRRQRDVLKSRIQSGEAAQENCLSLLETARQEVIAEKERITVLLAAQQKLQSEWNSVYSRYYMEGTAPTIWYNEESLEVLFKGKKEAYEQKNADLTDKRKLAEQYAAAASKSLDAIEYRGTSRKLLEQLHRDNRLQPVGKDELLAAAAKLSEQKKGLLELKSHLASAQERKNQLLGGIIHARRVIEDKYGVYEELRMSREKLAEYRKENRNALRSYEEQAKEMEQSAKQLEKGWFALESMKEELGAIIAEEYIDWQGESYCDEKEDLRSLYRNYKSQYDQAHKENFKRREAYERDKTNLALSLENAGAYELAAEIRRTLAIPESGADIVRQTEALLSSSACLELEKDRVGKGIVDMTRIKENFESQCLQSCLNIKTELDRLTNLSKITMDDKVISIIDLKIPYKKEEHYQEAMASYINQVVETADSFQSVQERLRYIKNQLAWKKLFGVIVTDMDAVRLHLYKRERIKEQSRYLRYEEAVGSTGQSQGIYIQFLIAIINYISSIYSRNANSLDLKKVIFIDNPFGAAKDIYIWEPIFKLLKSNHVQLIVPARGATPAITGRFEVNYILGQKLINQRQQTVVVDYRSQTSEADMEYRPLRFEQGTLEF